ncbi:MAG TPA: nucleoside 2-deoxyribosyltransferase [Woeseiaceae bacterium]
MEPLGYLAGGIAGLTGFDATDWRARAARSLADRGIETLDPMRAKMVLAGQERISSTFRDYEHYGAFFRSRGIMTRDFNDVKRCDALLVNLLGLTKPSLGTIMELAWAYAMQKPAVVAIEPEGNPHDGHPMIHEAIPFRVASLDEAIDSVAVILGR